MMIRSSTTNGNVVSQYTGSPSFAVLVEMACFNASGTLVPEGMASVVAGLLFWRQRLAVPATLVPYSALYGAGAVYLEFLTGQLPTAAGLLLGSAYLIGRLRPAPDDRPRAAWRLALAQKPRLAHTAWCNSEHTAWWGRKGPGRESA